MPCWVDHQGCIVWDVELGVVAMLLDSVLPLGENVQRCSERTQQQCDIKRHRGVFQTLNPKSMSILKKGFVPNLLIATEPKKRRRENPLKKIKLMSNVKLLALFNFSIQVFGYI
jgi:hypothetical protein